MDVGEEFRVCVRNRRIGIENCKTGLNTEERSPENLVLEVPYSEAPTYPPNQTPPTSDQGLPGESQVIWRIQNTYGSEPITLAIFGNDRGWTFHEVTPEVLPRPALL